MAVGQCDRAPLGTVRDVSTPIFRFVTSPAALASAPDGWATDVLADGSVSFLIDEGGIDAISEAAHALGAEAVTVLRHERTPELQEQTVRTHAHGLPLVWIHDSFSDEARRWAKDRGQMTLLVDNSGALDEEELGKIARFIAILGRQID